MKFNRQFADLQSDYNRPNQQGPFGGSVTWDRGPDGQLTQTATVGQQGQNMAAGLGGLADLYFQGAGDYLGSTPDFSSGGAFDRAYDYATANLEPRFERTRAATENRLRNQGLDPTSAAYKSAMNDVALQQNEARNSLVSGLQNQMFQQGIQGDQQMGARLGIGAPGLNAAPMFMDPGVSPFNPISTGTTPDYQGAAAQNFAQKSAQHSGMLGGIAGLGGKLLTAPMTGGGSLFGSFFG